MFTKDEEERMMENPSFNNNDDATFIGIYAYGMRDPGSYLSSKEVHDGMHLAAGRGFDRHGEWAATLAEISFILNIPGVPDEIKIEKHLNFTLEQLTHILISMRFLKSCQILVRHQRQFLICKKFLIYL